MLSNNPGRNPIDGLRNGPIPLSFASASRLTLRKVAEVCSTTPIDSC